MNAPLNKRAPDSGLSAIIKLAVMAVGGQGGGVLTGWIEALGRTQGYAVQATSVAGVAQRTGATIYYIEMAKRANKTPVFSLAPSAGNVDILVAAEMMEVGRAIMRGFVTPDCTVLIGSTHRALAVSEKMAPGDGIANEDEVRAAAEVAARRLILADFEGPAVRAGSVISASLFGALAGSGALPFERAAFEDTIRAGKGSVEASLAAFASGFALAEAGGEPARVAAPMRDAEAQPAGPPRAMADWKALETRAAALPEEVRFTALAGLRKVVEFQDAAYGAAYLDRLNRVRTVDGSDKGWELTAQAAKYIANAMAYDDMIRVAGEKIRPGRLTRVRAEMGGFEVMRLTEFAHPRAEEIVSLLPAGLGRWVQARPRLFAWIDRRVNKGRRLRTDRILPFLQLWLLAGLRGWRLRSLRHAEETAHLENWLETALEYADGNYALGVETLAARRLVKGYSDTHARGLSKFDRVMKGIAIVAGREDAADWARRLTAASLQDEAGDALDGTLKTIASFADIRNDA